MDALICRIILIIIPILISGFISYFITIQVYKKQQKISEKINIYNQMLEELYDLKQYFLTIQEYNARKIGVMSLHLNNAGVPGVEEEIRNEETYLTYLESRYKSESIEFNKFSEYLINKLEKILDTKSYLLEKEILDDIRNLTQNFFFTENDDPDWYTDERIEQIQKLCEKIKARI